MIYFRTGKQFFAQVRKSEYLFISFKKKSSAPLQCRCGNSAEIFLAFVHKQFAENPETILKIHSFSGIGFLPINVPLDICTAITTTILKYFWQTPNFFWLKTQNIKTRLIVFKQIVPQKVSLHTQKALATALRQNLSTNVSNPFGQRPNTFWKVISFSEKHFLQVKYSAHVKCRYDYSPKNIPPEVQVSFAQFANKQMNTYFIPKNSSEWSFGYMESFVDKATPFICWQSLKIMSWASKNHFLIVS